MRTKIGTLAVRRSIYIDAPPERVWEEFESLERMRGWYGVGHKLVTYEPRVGAEVLTDVGGEEYHFVGKVKAFDPAKELTFEQQWVGKDWPGPVLITIKLTPVGKGTHVELFQHGFEQFDDPGETHFGFENAWDLQQLSTLRERAVA